MPRAPKACATVGCETRVRARAHCDEHEREPWHGSTWQTQGKPPGWDATRTAVLERDRHVCWWCQTPGATAVDHLVPRVVGGSDDPSNLAPIHASPCHEAKTRADQERYGR